MQPCPKSPPAHAASSASRTSEAAPSLKADGNLGHTAVWVAFALALTALAHSPALGGDFVWDDHQLIEEQRIVRELQPLQAYFANSFWSSPYDEARGFFRPLVTLSYALEWRLWDGAPAGFHATNLLLHLLNCMLVFAIARKGRARTPLAVSAMFLFGVFPRLTESVSWISGRTDLMAAFFALSAVLLHRSAPHRPAARVGAAAAIFLGLLCKEVALAGAAAIGVFELRRLLADDAADPSPIVRRRRFTDCAYRLSPLLAAGAAYAALRLHSGTAVSASDALPLFPSRLAMTLSAVGRYAWMLLWPYEPKLQIGDLGIVEIPFAVGGAAVLALIAGCLFHLGVRRIAESDAADLLAMGGTALLLVVHLVPLDVNVIAADRFLYVPAACLASAGAAFLSRLPLPLPQRLRLPAAALPACLALAFFGCTWMAARVWSDERALWEKACLDASHFNAAVWLGLAGILDTEGLPVPSLRATIKASDKASDTDTHVSQAAAVNVAQGIQLIAGPDASAQLLSELIASGNLSRAISKRAFLDLALVHARAGRLPKAIELLQAYAAENPQESAPRALLTNIRRAKTLADALPAVPLKDLTAEQLKTRYAQAELLTDRLASTNVLLEMLGRADVDDDTKNEAAAALRASGLCHRLQESGFTALTEAPETARRCRPLPAELERQLPPLNLGLPPHPERRP